MGKPSSSFLTIWHWVDRKQELDITQAMPLQERLERIREARTQKVTHAPVRVQGKELAQQIERLERSISGLEGYLGEVRTERALEEGAARTGRQRPVPDQWRTERVLAKGMAHGLPRDHEAEKTVAVAQTFARMTKRTRTHRVSQARERLSHGQDEAHPGGGLNVRLTEKEREREQGMGW